MLHKQVTGTVYTGTICENQDWKTQNKTVQLDSPIVISEIEAAIGGKLNSLKSSVLNFLYYYCLSL